MADVKIRALELAHASAMRVPPATGIDPANILADAKMFEKFLNGTDEKDAKEKWMFNQIAMTAHEVNRVLQTIQKESYISPSWYECTEEIRRSAIDGVKKVYQNPEITPEDLHQNWLDFKAAEGWTYGHERDDAQKKHPCCVPYRDLPESQQNKDLMFQTVVRTLLGL